MSNSAQSPSNFLCTLATPLDALLVVVTTCDACLSSLRPVHVEIDNSTSIADEDIDDAVKSAKKAFETWKETTKDELNGGVSVNLTVLAYYNGKATTKDFLDLARRISKVTLAADFVTGEYQKEPRQPRVLGSLIKINKPKRGKLMGALKRVAVNA